MTIDHGGEGQIDSNIDLTVPSITLSDRDSITAARSSLNGSLASIIDGVSSLNTNTGSHKTTGTKDTAKRCVWRIAKMKFQNNIIAGKTVKQMCHHCCI